MCVESAEKQYVEMDSNPSTLNRVSPAGCGRWSPHGSGPPAWIESG